MFGFGQTQPSSFGSGFGSFGQQPQSQSGFGFGSTPATQSSFSLNAPSTGAFGMTAQSVAQAPSFSFGQTSQTRTTGFGGFGQPTQQTTSAFGGFGATPATASAFGTSTFGAASTGSSFGGFGQQSAPSQSNFGFGNQTQTGAQQQTSLFGGAFGQTQPQTSGFGGFGSTQSQPQQSSFGFSNTGSTFSSQPSTSTFGSFGSGFGQPSTTASGFGSIGGAPIVAVQKGTRHKAFEPLTEKSGAETYKYFNIIAMNEYANRTLDELRWEDYEARHTPDMVQKNGVTSTFGQPSTTTGFGFSATSSAFGQPSQPSAGFGFGQQQTQTQSGFGFGSTAIQTAFGSTGSGFGFGNTGSSLFGVSSGSQPSSAFSFGQQSAPAQTSFAFGQTQPQTQSSFGFGTATSTTQGAQPSFSNGLFGQQQSQPQTTFGFGTQQTQASTAPSFGFSTATQPASSNFTGFGSLGASSSAPLTSFSFGATSSGFGAPQQQTSTSLFGGATTSSLFSSSTSSTSGGGFGSFGFGASQPASQSAFTWGASPSTQQASSQPGFSFGSFGSTQQSQPQQTTFGFGATQSTTQPSFGFGGTAMPSFGQTFGQQAHQQQQQAQQVQHKIDENPYFSSFFTQSAEKRKQQTALALTQQQALTTMQQSQHAAGTALIPLTSTTQQVALNYATIGVTPRSAARLRTRRQIFAQTPLQPSASKQQQLLLQHELLMSARSTKPKSLSGIKAPKVMELQLEPEEDELGSEEQQSPLDDRKGRISASFSSPQVTRNLNASLAELSSAKRNNAPPTATSIQSQPSAQKRAYPNLQAPILTNTQMYTVPSMAELREMSADQLKAVENFKVAHQELGSITWLQPVDVRQVNLDDVVQFSVDPKNGNAVLEVYPDGTVMPPPGQQLNALAQITLYSCYPNHQIRTAFQRNLQLSDKQQQRMEQFKNRLKQTPATHFREYDAETGKWVFEVELFGNNE